ncbi:MAG TPA: serine protease [Actinophytocola sp.]|uniref:S1 family peptidase n=1 Tax=Actinophytocola sp. TaxID=1872138 RepID=UPI002DB9398B|nr:serine protease [Actinophytocola sp.]HEU5475532.1 serine protease [Actinophytocola sp.]
MAARIATLGVTAAALLLAVPPPVAAQPSSPEELAAAVARPAVVLIQVSWRGWVRDRRTGEVFGGNPGYHVTVTCTGTVISPDGYVATASHCVHTGAMGGSAVLFDAAATDLARVGRVTDPARARALLAEHAVAEGAKADSAVDRQIQVRFGDDIAPATVANVVAPDQGDVAVLKVPRDRLPAVAIRPDPAPVGTPILAIGYPGSVEEAGDRPEPSTKNGQISAQRTHDEHPFYEFSAAATHGMSGGPVVDMQGRVVGLISRGTPGETQSFNLATAAATLLDVVRDKEINAEQGAHDRNYRSGLDRYYAGDYDGSVEFLDAVLAAAPEHEQAAAYRKLAVERGGSVGSGNPLLLVFLFLSAGIGLLAGGLGLAVLRLHRRALLSTMDTPPFGFPLPAQVSEGPTEVTSDAPTVRNSGPDPAPPVPPRPDPSP